MRNLIELQPILAAIYCINRTSGHEDEDIRNIIDYAYDRILGNTTRILLLACIGRTKADAMPEILQVLKEDTTTFNIWRNTKMIPYKVHAHIHSLKGEMREITVLDKTDNNRYIVEYGGVKCTAVFNWFVCEFYADDVYGIIKENEL